ncbi:MAG: response regulator receiver modulated CheB methylesterase [Acidimicrobiales bacterium]|nr:response regulator receiver modulated CheB methylesterase [Acidimicrobiales bacterium]
MIRVVVVEDSLVQRAHLVKSLEADGDIAVVGEAVDAKEAVERVQALQPDVVTLDLGIPGGGGQHAIEQIMAFFPTPILVLSASVSNRESQSAVEALVAGAVDAMPKPMPWSRDAEETVRNRVRVLRGVSVVRHSRGRRTPARPSGAAPPALRATATPVVAIGASAGGPAALATVLAGLEGLPAAVLVVQHLDAAFMDGFVTWMQRVSGLPVELAVDGTALRPGVVSVGPGDVHLKLGRDDRIVLDPEPRSLHRPSVDVLFSSLAGRSDRRRVGVILTGMGNDGATGLLALRRGGGVTIAQDEETSAVYGMPQAAQRVQAATHILPLQDIAAAVMRSA